MARTRSKGSASTGGGSKLAQSTSTSTSTTTKYALPPQPGSPPQLVVLPKRATADARIVTLQDPRSSKPNRYLVCPETGFYEFVATRAPRNDPRSWLVEDASPAASADGERSRFDAAVISDSTLYMASPLDPLFLVLPGLCATTSSKASDADAPKRLFLSSDDHLDAVGDPAGHLAEVVRRWPGARRRLEARMAAVCDTVEAGDETMFRLSEAKLLAEILSKAQRMAAQPGGLPRSMEAKFVAKPLEAPFFAPAPSAAPAAAGVVSSSESPSATTDDAGVATPRTETTESQLSTSSAETTDTTETSTSEASTAATSVAASEPGARGTTEELQVAMTPSEEVVRLQRIRVAFDLLCAKYVPPPVAEDLRKALAARTDPVDFGPLQAYLGRLAQLREADVAARSMAEHARKRTREEDDDERAEKRRRKEEEEKRKKGGESRGVRELKKVNVSGMMKLSAFFKKKG